MALSPADLNKTWIPGPSRGTQTFNAPSNLTIPYGRFAATVSGRGGSGNVPQASAWASNYNTNYNTVYPIANQPIANQPANAWATNYNTNYNVAHVTNHHIGHYYTYYNFNGYQVHAGFWDLWSQGPYPGGPIPHFNRGNWYHCPSPWSYNAQWALYGCPYVPGNIAYGAYHQSETHAVYPVANRPIANQPATTWSTNYNTNYNVAYPIANRPIANQPATTWSTNYNTNYNTVYPIANRPIANQPATTWSTNYNTNYNVAYPIANQPLSNQPTTAYTPGNVGQSTNVLGVTFPGGPIDTSGFGGIPGTAPTVPATAVTYWTYPDNATYPVAVPPGGQIVVTIT